jgi:hypothetical protein
MAAIHAGFRVLYREAHVLFEDLLLAGATNERSAAIAAYSEIPLLIIDDLGMRKLPASAAEDLLEIVMRRYENASTILTSNRPLDDWPKLFGDTPAVAAFLDRLMHHSQRSLPSELRQQLETRTTAQRTVERAQELLKNFWTHYDAACYEDRRELIAAIVRALGGAKATKDAIIWERQIGSGARPRVSRTTAAP